MRIDLSCSRPKGFPTGDTWEYDDLISKQEVYDAFDCEPSPFQFAKAVFNRGYVEYQKEFNPTYCDIVEEDRHYLVNLALSEYFQLPKDIFYLFPTTRENILRECLKDENLLSYIIYILISRGNSYRKSAELLNCSYSKVYNIYKRFTQKHGLVDNNEAEEEEEEDEEDEKKEK